MRASGTEHATLDYPKGAMATTLDAGVYKISNGGHPAYQRILKTVLGGLLMHTKHRGISHIFARAVAATMLVAAPLAVSGSSMAVGTCTSPRTTSPVYTGDHQSGVSSTDQSTWRVGTLAITNQPAADIVVGYKIANTQNNWRDSKPMSTKTASRILLKIGSGDVQFSTMYRANSGSSACSNAPATVFSPTAQPIDSIAPNTTQPNWP